MSNKRKRILLTIFVLIFLAGLFLFLYPCIRGAYLEQRQRQQTQSFLAYLDDAAEEPTGSTDEAEDTSPLALLRKDMEAYNEQIFEENQVKFDSSAAYEQPSFLLSDYGLTDEVFAVLSIPALELEMPVYLGANTVNLSLGAAHMSQTSLPIGGENTNCVIAGHRGWQGADYFLYITKLQPGDEVIVKNLWETLTYRVVSTKDISSRDTESILIQPGKDLLTLLTCDYGAGGTKYRFIVICERADAA
ncbi:MAG: class C sortase [Oscillospiraceae bacterium]|nr:class C sortase [Oscillospiraceae bacterium]